MSQLKCCLGFSKCPHVVLWKQPRQCALWDNRWMSYILEPGLHLQPSSPRPRRHDATLHKLMRLKSTPEYLANVWNIFCRSLEYPLAQYLTHLFAIWHILWHPLTIRPTHATMFGMLCGTRFHIHLARHNCVCGILRHITRCIDIFLASSVVVAISHPIWHLTISGILWNMDTSLSAEEEVDTTDIRSRNHHPTGTKEFPGCPTQ